MLYIFRLDVLAQYMHWASYAALAVAIATEKHRSWLFWRSLALLAGPIGLLVAVLPSRKAPV
jgi:hypothetical protein